MPAPPLPEAIGRYRILRAIGRGAMGRVFLAEDPVLERHVAVKLLRDDLKLPPEELDGLWQRMRQEARASARVSHPNIVALYDMGQDDHFGLYLVFEYAEGNTLKECLRRGPLNPDAAAQLARELGDALTTAHDAGILHRDIKPENIILTKTGSKVADFGIARIPNSTLTRHGVLLGTPAYSAPEAIASGDFSPLSDQFSMAATLYEALSAQRAFPGDDAVTVASRIATDDPPPIARSNGLAPYLDLVLSQGLAKDSKRRFPSAADLGRAVADALTLKPRTAMATEPDALHQHHAKRQHQLRSSTTLLLTGIAGVLLGAFGMRLIHAVGFEPGTRPVRAETVPFKPETSAKPSAPREPAPAPKRTLAAVPRSARAAEFSDAGSTRPAPSEPPQGQASDFGP